MKRTLRATMICMGGFILPNMLTAQITGPSTTTSPYLVSSATGVTFTSVLKNGNTIGGYKFVGLPDGAGAFDNGDTTFTLVLNHEMGSSAGATHAHGSTGAFVSKWRIHKTTLAVLSGSDLMQSVALWNPLTSSYTTYNSAFPSSAAAFTRFCSADLPAVSAFYNAQTGKGTQERIFMNGEESGNEGRAMAHIITGPNGGKSFELPYLGKLSWENAVACPYESDKTIVAGLDDQTPGQVYIYIGAKSTSGNEIERAGLTGGKLYGVKVSGLTAESSSSIPAAGTAFSLYDLGYVQNTTGATINSNSNSAGVTTFLRPEDGAWDPANPGDFYFATTNSFSSPSRLWRLRFTDMNNPTLGGTITALLDGTEGQKMMDNLTIDNYGHVILTEDVGNNSRLGRIWEYTIATDALVEIGTHDSTRFLTGGTNFLTEDEESSGIIDMEAILGAGKYILVDQAHYSVSGDEVEGGQLLMMYNPTTYNSAPEANVSGAGNNIVDGDSAPSSLDNTDFGTINVNSSVTKTFVINNTGVGPLVISGINFTGANALEFSLVTPPTFPATVAGGSSLTITAQFLPLAAGTRTATINIMNNDATERKYDFALQGTAVEPEIALTGNSIAIASGDMTAGGSNNTDFGNVNVGGNIDKNFVIHNTGAGSLTVTGITFTGSNASDFTLSPAPAFPLVVAAAGTATISARFSPGAAGARNATINIASNDVDESTYNFALKGNGVDATRVIALNSASAIRLYPNPASDITTLEIKMDRSSKISVSVIDLQGMNVLPVVVKNMTAGRNVLDLNTAALPNGLYMVRIADEVSSTNIKLTVIR